MTDKSRFMLLQPETLEQGMKLMVKFASAGVDLIVVDSVGAGVPEKFFADLEDSNRSVSLLRSGVSSFLSSRRRSLTVRPPSLASHSFVRRWVVWEALSITFTRRSRWKCFGSITHVSV